ncbi:MAG: hypothetical protein PHE51_11445 [Eubacteriales bacterium]|nr:hypothetical protein [Eubacteriales bacterium]
MKKYEQPTLDVVELSVKENITADEVYGEGIAFDSTTGVTTYNLRLYSQTGSEQA